MARLRLWRVRRWMFLNRGELLGFSMALLAFVLAILFATGCGTQTMPSHANVPVKDGITMPVVEFCCDEISQGLVAYAISSQVIYSVNPSWKCDDCKAGNTTTQALAGFAPVLAANPNVVVFITGTYDLIPAPGTQTWMPECGNEDITCNNLAGMISQTQAAGAKVIVCTVPPWGAGELATQLAPDGLAGADEFWYHHLISQYGPDSLGDTGIPLLDLQALLAQPGIATNRDPYGAYQVAYTDNGVDPNNAGYQAVIDQVYLAIEQLHVGKGVI